jgi:phosphoribosyl-AMP cyclohydrolase
MGSSANEESLDLWATLKFDAHGLIPCVVQDYKDGTVFMVAYMNRESVRRTLAEKRAVYWSRSRQSFWIKGEQSGHLQELKELRVDCDGDCLLIKVNQVGGAACHTGRRSDFYRRAASADALEITDAPVFDPKKVYGK